MTTLLTAPAFIHLTHATAAPAPGSTTALTWTSSPGKSGQVTATNARRGAGTVNHARTTRGSVAWLRSNSSPAQSTSGYTVWLRSPQKRQARVRVVHPNSPESADRIVYSRTLSLPARTWKRVSVQFPVAPKASKNLQVRVKLSDMRRGQQVKVSAHRSTRQVVATPTTSPTRGPSTEASTSKPTTAPTTRPAAVPNTGALSNGCAHTARGIPSCGAFLGMAYGSNSDPTALESAMGGRLGVRRTYYTATQVNAAVKTARTDLAKGRLPWISFKFPHNWSAMSKGAGDAWARGIAQQLSTLNGPVWVAFHHEPENDGDMALWRATQERLAPIVRSTAHNVAYTVILTGWHQFYGPKEFSLDNVWPRTTVDLAGFDVYNSLGVVKGGKTYKATDMDGAYFAKIQAWAKPKGLAWGLAETGYTDVASTQDPEWIKRTHQQLANRGGVAMAYFNTTLNSIAPWSLSSATKKSAYKNAQTNSPRLPLR